MTEERAAAALDSMVDRLTKPERLFSRDELLNHPTCPVPRASGVYAWFFRSVLPGVPLDGCIDHRGMHLLYVGISPDKQGKPGSLQNESAGLSSFIWSVADLLRGRLQAVRVRQGHPAVHGAAALDCVLESTKEAVLKEYAEKQKLGINPEPFLLRKSGQRFFNTSPLDMKKLMGDQDHIQDNLSATSRPSRPRCATSSSGSTSTCRWTGSSASGLLYLVTEKFAQIDLHPDVVTTTRWAWCSRS
jgi:hypothetical protein